jgi:outer membrane protein
VKAKNKCLRLSLVFVVAFIASIAFTTIGMAESVSPVKIGFVDTNKIMRDSKAAKKAREVFQKDLDAKKGIIKAKSDKVVNLDKDLKNVKKDSPGWKEKNEKFVKEVNELRNLEKNLNEELKKKDFELTKKIYEDVEKIMKKIASSEKYSIIFDRKAALLVEDGSDLTDKVIKIYDAQK